MTGSPGGAVQLIGVCTSTWLYFKLLIDAGVLLPDAGIAGWKAVLYDPQFSPVVGRAWLLLSGIRRACGLGSLTWVANLGTGGEKAMDLVGHDELPSGLSWCGAPTCCRSGRRWPRSRSWC